MAKLVSPSNSTSCVQVIQVHQLISTQQHLMSSHHQYLPNGSAHLLPIFQPISHILRHSINLTNKTEELTVFTLPLCLAFSVNMRETSAFVRGPSSKV